MFSKTSKEYIPKISETNSDYFGVSEEIVNKRRACIQAERKLSPIAQKEKKY